MEEHGMMFLMVMALTTVTYVLGVPLNQLDEEVMPLERAITYTDPIVPLKFVQTVKKKPRKKHLKLSKLLKKMGDDFDAKFMAIDKPSDDPEVLKQVELSDDQLSELIEQVGELNLEQELSTLDKANHHDKDEQGSAFDRQTVALFEQWLIQKSSCPVTFEWTDLGDYFWPRWIRKGQCSDEKDNGDPDKHEEGDKSNNQGCSWPFGMHCRSNETKTLQILRWHCRRRPFARSHKRKRRRRNRIQCRWFKVPYPVTTTCKCSCH